jgi:hypothetical protein
VPNLAPEIIQRFPEPFCKLDPRLPSQQRAGLGDIGAAARWIVHRQIDKAQFALRSRDVQNGLRALQNRELHRVSNVDREVLLALRQAHDALDQIVDVTEAARLLAVAVDGQRFAAP